jgi:Glutaredoxin and related proteins
VNKVIMYSTQVCPYCQMAERLLKSRGVEHVEKVLIDKDPARREEMMTRTGRRTCRRCSSARRMSAGTMTSPRSIARAV